MYAAEVTSMSTELEGLLDGYESGRLTRRELVLTLTTLLASRAASGQAAQPAVGAIRQLNHVTLFVEDVNRSVSFYQRLFGMPVLTPQEPGINLAAGGGFLGIYPAQGRPTGVNHVCFGLDNFDADATLERLQAQGLEANIRLRGDTKELYFNAPDNVRVQLQDVRYRGGVGPLGDRDPV
jgi:catechol 2,3-dioxygenase-like lactoylglutathione lyase family enzyme